MLSKLESRLDRLEREAGVSPESCERCARVETNVILPSVDGAKWHETEQHGVSFPCPSCGRPREISVRVIEPRQPHESALIASYS